MRAWTNMGISQANVGQYDLSSRYYVRALGLNPRCGDGHPSHPIAVYPQLLLNR